MVSAVAARMPCDKTAALWANDNEHRFLAHVSAVSWGWLVPGGHVALSSIRGVNSEAAPCLFSFVDWRLSEARGHHESHASKEAQPRTIYVFP